MRSGHCCLLGQRIQCVYIKQWFMGVNKHEQEFICLIRDCHKQCFHFYLEHCRQSQMTNPTDCFCVKQAQGHICINQPHKYKLAVHQVKGEEHPHIVVREMVSVSSSWWEQREGEERDRIVRPQNPFSLSLLSIAFPPQQRSPDSPDIAALWHSIISQRLQAMGKGSVSWSTWGAKLKSGNMWAFEAGHKRRQSVSD